MTSSSAAVSVARPVATGGRIKVAFVGPYPLNPQKVNGGIQAVVRNLVCGFMDLDDVEIHVVTVDFDHDDEVVREAGVQLHYFTATKGMSQFMLYARERGWICEKLNEIQPDVVHVHGTDMYGLASRSWSFPTVLTVHGILQREAHIDHGHAGLSGRMTRRIKGAFNSHFEKRTLAHAGQIIVISRYVADMLGGLHDKQCYSIDNPVDNRFFELADQTVRNRLLFVGMIRARKGVLHLLQAIDKLGGAIPDLKLHIVGKVFEPEYDRALRQFVADHDLDNHVAFRGRLSDDELFREFEECQALVLPSQEETSPMVVEQAMSAGKAVIATRVGGVPYLVEQGASGLLVDFGDSDALAEAIGTICADPDRARAMGARGREIARQRFQLSAIVARTKEVYRNVISPAEVN